MRASHHVFSKTGPFFFFALEQGRERGSRNDRDRKTRVTDTRFINLQLQKTSTYTPTKNGANIIHPLTYHAPTIQTHLHCTHETTRFSNNNNHTHTLEHTWRTLDTHHVFAQIKKTNLRQKIFSLFSKIEHFSDVLGSVSPSVVSVLGQQPLSRYQCVTQSGDVQLEKVMFEWFGARCLRHFFCLPLGSFLCPTVALGDLQDCALRAAPIPASFVR